MDEDYDIDDPEYKKLLIRLDPNDQYRAKAYIQMAVMDGCQTTSSKLDPESEYKAGDLFNDEIKQLYNELMEKLNANDQKLFKGAIEQAKIKGSKMADSMIASMGAAMGADDA